MQNRIFSIDNSKASKSIPFGYLNAIHYMAPHDIAGVGNLCPHATEGCKSLCLGQYSGHAGMVRHDDDINSVRQSRIDKAQRFMQDRAAYLEDVCRSIVSVEFKARNLYLIPVVRLNGSTDIAWEGIAVTWRGVRYPNIMAAFPPIQFVDYTKSSHRMYRELPHNYHLTFSRSETNEAECMDLLADGFNVAAVFRKVPRKWKGFTVIDGDIHDLRHLDPKGVVVGLTPKGRKAKADTSGFVI
jgi:hypothetical protein